MKRRATVKARRAQPGFSLVELMIAMTIGLVIALVIGELFVANQRTYTVQDENARVQENARFALAMLSRQVRMAGFRRSECNAAAVCFFDSGANAVIAGSNDGDTNSSDRIQIQFFGSDNTAGTASDNSVADCLGNSKRMSERVNDTFLIAPNPANSNEPTLYCQRAGDAAPGTPLVAGVESMQILYGEDSNQADAAKTADRYLPAGNPSLDMTRVVSVRISMLFRSNTGANTAVDTRKYNHFGSQYAPGDVAPAGDLGAVFNAAGANLDTRLRRIFQTTIALRNRTN